MVKPQENLWTQNIGRLDIQKVLKPDPGTETVEVWGEVEVYNGAGLIRARNLRLKSIQNLILTVDSDARAHGDRFASKWVYEKGRKGNYASIYLWDLSTGIAATGSDYVNFLALGE